MSKSKKKTKGTYPISAVQHAAKLTQDFAQVYEQIEKPEENLVKLSLATEKKGGLRKRVDGVITQGLLEQVCPAFPTKAKRRNFRNLICHLILDILSSMVPRDKFEAIHQSFRGLVPKIQALDVASQRREWSPRALQHVQTAEDEVSASTDDKRSDVHKETSKQVLQPAIRLQGSVDFSIDQKRNKEPDERTEIKVKEEGEDETATTDPTGFTITLGIPTAPGDHRFYIRFNSKHVVDCLSSMPSNGIWQLVHDAIQQDSDIPQLSLPRVTEVYQLDDERLALSFRTAEDLRTLSANVQWVRTFRDTLSSGIKAYIVVFEFVEKMTMKMETHADRALIIEQIREENLGKSPSLTQIGAIRDIIMPPGPIFDSSLHIERNDYADYVIVFGSRAAANTAMDTGLSYLGKSHKVVIYAPNEQWHQQCSHCQAHNHTAKDCHSTLLCGRCGYKHATRYCTSATFKCANCHGKHVSTSMECVKWQKAEANARRGYQFPAEADSERQTPAPSEAALHTLSSPELLLPKARKVHESTDKKPRQGFTPRKSAQSAPDILPANIRLKNQHIPDEISRPPPTTMPPPAIRTNPQYTPEPPSSPPTPLNRSTSTHYSPPTPAPSASSALLQTIDEFRAFVAARESNANPRKRKQSEYVMTGALQLEEHEGKRVKRVKQKGEEVEGGEDGEEEREDEGPVWPIGHEGYRPPPPLRRRESRAALLQALSKLAD